MNAKISVIIPVYNVEKYLKQCVDSVINQTFKNLQIILIDDGSTDSSGLICDEYAKKDSRVTVRHSLNGGQSEARNLGLSIADGDYIGFVDSDDFIHPQMYEFLYNCITKYDLLMTCCVFSRDNPDNFLQIKKIEDVPVRLLSNTEAMNDIGSIWTTAWNKLYKKEVFLDILFPKGKFHEDDYIIHRIVYKTKNIAVINCPLYFYRRTENSIMNTKDIQKNIQKFYDSFEAFKDRIDFSLEKNWSEILSTALKRYCEYAVEQYIFLKNNKNYPTELKKICQKNICNLLNNKFQIETAYKLFAKSYLLYSLYLFFKPFLNLYKDIKLKIKKVFYLLFCWEINSNKFLRKKIDFMLKFNLIPKIKSTKSDYIISLTTYGKRFEEIHYTLYSLFLQSYKPDKIVLWLDEKEFSEDNIKQNRKLTKLVKHGLEIKFCENYGSYKKFIPALKEFPESKIIICDDDAFYNKNWLKILVEEEQLHPEMILCHKGTLIETCNKKLLHYKLWPNCTKVFQGKNILPVGVGGTLLKKSFFYKDVLDEKIFYSIAPNADDLWIWCQAVLNNTEIKILDNFLFYPKDLGDDRNWEKLCISNVDLNGNNDKMKKIIEYYPELKRILNIE